MSLDPFGDKWTIASFEEVSSPGHIQKRAGLTEHDVKHVHLPALD